MSTVTRPIENPVTSGEEGGEGGPGTEFKNDIERRVYEKLKAADLPDAHIAAIMANFDVETMGFTRMKQLNNGPGRGLAQWGLLDVGIMHLNGMQVKVKIQTI